MRFMVASGPGGCVLYSEELERPHTKALIDRMLISLY